MSYVYVYSSIICILLVLAVDIYRVDGLDPLWLMQSFDGICVAMWETKFKSTRPKIDFPCMFYTRFLSLRPICDVMGRYRFGSTLAQVMACCLTAPSHYLNQCWLIISAVLWRSPESNFTASVPAIILYMSLKIILLKLLPHLPGANELKELYKLEIKITPHIYHPHSTS